MKNWFQKLLSNGPTCNHYDKVLADIGVAPERAVMFEDSFKNLKVGLYKLNSVVTHSLKAPGFNP